MYGGGGGVAQSCPTLCDPMDCSPPGSSVHGIFQARELEWAAISFSRGSSRPRDRTWVSHILCIVVYIWASQVALVIKNLPANAGDIRDVASIPGGRSHGGGHDNLLQYPCLENPMDRGVWPATAHWVVRSWTRLKQHSMQCIYVNPNLSIPPTPLPLVSTYLFSKSVSLFLLCN